MKKAIGDKNHVKKAVKIITVGAMATSIMVSGITFASGGSLQKTIDVFFNKVNVEVNEQKLTGDSILYDGKTYVYVRDIAEALDKDVKWDGDTKTVSITDKNQAGPNIEQVTVSTKEIKSESELLIEGLEMPVIEGLQDESLQKKLNAEFENKAIEYRNKIAKGAAEFAEEAKKQGWTMRPFHVYTEYTVPYNQNNLLSVSVKYSEYTGGAHGNYKRVTSNIDLTTGKTLTLKDLFKPEADYKSIIIKEMEKKIKAEPEKYFEEYMRDIEKAFENQNFYITDENLVIYYNPYQIASFAQGIVEFKIPFSQFGDNVNYDFGK